MSVTGTTGEHPQREADVALRDGTTVHVRPACPGDAPKLQSLFERLSADSRYLRFFSASIDMPRVVNWAADVDYQRRDGLVAVTGPGERIVAHAVLLVEIPTLLTSDALRRFEEREERAASAALRKLLAPRSVAVIGASRRRGTVGGELFHNLLAAGFTGPVYPVNPKAASVQSVGAYPTVEDVPGPVDLAVLAIPAAQVVQVARACAAKGVGALVVLSAGFAESGPEGAERQRELLAVCRQSGMRLIGPNCLGVINTDPAVRLDATFGPTLPARGRVGFGSQSGALGLAIVDYANDLGLGLSSFLSVGNKADISGNDLLGYWQDDPDTDMVLLYLESFGNPRKFARYGQAIELVASSGEADAMVIIHVPPLAGEDGTEQVAAAVRRAAAQAPPAMTMQAAFMRSGDAPAALREDSRPIPCYQFPEEAARALARAADRGQWLGRPEGAVPALPGIHQAEAAALIADALATGPRWLTIEESTKLLGCYGLPMAAGQVARTPEEAGELAARLGGRVAVKAIAPGLLHKTEAGAVRLSLVGPSDVTHAAADLTRALEGAGQRPTGFLVQRMATGVAELLVGVVHDPTFGPVVAVGAGGTSAELLGDVTVRLAPLTDRDAAEALHELTTFPLLDGWRGAPAVDQEALEDLLLRVGLLADDHPEIAELECNPVIAGPDGAVIVDVRVRVELPSASLPLSARRR
jgi:acyl-CoA synthetase (NDP forming)